MCLNPISIKKQSSVLKFRDRSVGNEWIAYKAIRSYLPTDGFSLAGGMQVPCGKCIECLQYKQNKRVPLIVQEMQHVGEDKVCFVTLTYDNDTCPLALSYCNEDSKHFRVLSPDVRSFYVGITHYSLTGTLKPLSFDDHYKLVPSLNREDVRLFIKRNRVAFERLGRPMDFKYICVGEYGPRTNRPHYHLLIFGLTYSECREFFKFWSSEFGFFYVESVHRDFVSKSGKPVKDGFVAVSRYICKYMSKGCFECQFVKDGIVEAPRVMSSVHIGCDDLPENLVKLIAPYHLIGEDCEENLRKLLVHVQTRYITYPNMKSHFPIPDVWKRKFLYTLHKYEEQKSNGERVVRYIYIPNALQNSLSLVMAFRFAQRRSEQLQGLENSIFAESLDSFLVEFFRAEDTSRQAAAKARSSELRRFYATSLY